MFAESSPPKYDDTMSRPGAIHDATQCRAQKVRKAYKSAPHHELVPYRRPLGSIKGTLVGLLTGPSGDHRLRMAVRGCGSSTARSPCVTTEVPSTTAAGGAVWCRATCPHYECTTAHTRPHAEVNSQEAQLWSALAHRQRWHCLCYVLTGKGRPKFGVCRPNIRKTMGGQSLAR